jgi:hypothetical protein
VGAPDTDHLASLFFNGAGPVGRYTPERVTLSLPGQDRLADRVVYLHEIHHRGLNDSTAWGAALQIYAELPEPYRECFVLLLDLCRTTHEAYATFASVNVASSRHPHAADLLVAYPDYLPLYSALKSGVAGAGGPHREYMLATALARLAMQTPILDAMTSSADFMVLPSSLAPMDVPDRRWTWLMKRDPQLLAAAAQAGDLAIGDTGLLELDDGTHDEIADDEHDAAWQSWEHAAYGVLAAALQDAGAHPLAFNEHMEFTGLALARARELQPGLRLRSARVDEPAPDDRALAGAATERVRLTLTDNYNARLIDLELEQFVDEVANRCQIQDEPTCVLSVRLPSRLLDGYSWSDEDRAAIEARAEPLVAAKVVETDEESSDIAHLVVQSPAFATSLAAAWAGRGPALTVVAASALLDRNWQREWITALRFLGPVVILIDVALDRFVQGWVRAGTHINAGMVQISDTSGTFWALALSTDQPSHDSASELPDLWLAVLDEVTAGLLLQQLQRTEGLSFSSSTADVERWGNLFAVAVTNLLATEPFLDLEGLDEATLARFREPA